jgi:GNAT superfamily N-acetyltransferase
MTIRKARKTDINEIVQMLANDPLGASREDVLHPEKYEKAFDIIDADKNQSLMIVEGENGKVIGTFQMTFIQYLTHQGSMRVQVESVRVREDYRGKGIGENMFEWIIDYSKARGAHLLQLTSDKKRPDAIRFYQKLGFLDSHEGLKMAL